jgi:hypothetical protein
MKEIGNMEKINEDEVNKEEKSRKAVYKKD